MELDVLIIRSRHLDHQDQDHTFSFKKCECSDTSGPWCPLNGHYDISLVSSSGNTFHCVQLVDTMVRMKTSMGNVMCKNVLGQYSTVKSFGFAIHLVIPCSSKVQPTKYTPLK